MTSKSSWRLLIFVSFPLKLDNSRYHLQYEDNSNPLVENGFCNDETNTEECIYDGGDCCGSDINPDINTDHCLSEDYLFLSLVC